MIDKPSGHFPRLLTREQAAAYCGYSPSGFSARVADGTLPGSISGLARWDKHAIDRRLDELSGLVPAAPQQQSHVQDFEAEKLHAADLDWIAWGVEQRRRSELWPQYNLNVRQARALDALAKYDPTPVSSTVVAGAGNKTFEQLIERELACEYGPDQDGDRTFVLTGLGRDEYQRYQVKDEERP